MFGMWGLPINWVEPREESEGGPAILSTDDVVEADDIVEVAVRDRKPVMCSATRFDDLANLRVLGIIETENTTLYLMLVTEYDMKVISPVDIVDKWKAMEYEVEDRFVGEHTITISESHIRKIVLKQNGRFCSKCKDYNRDVRLPRNVEFICKACVTNPYR